jgi:CheY-like chemotaxis protein
MNLLGNSLKFTDRGSISLSVNWLPGSLMVTDQCFEPVPYDSESEGVFEKEQGLYLLSMDTQKQESKGHLVLTNNKSKEFVRSLETLENNQDSTGILKIIINDTGCGISKKGLGELFQKFSQVSDDPCKRQIGTGLGLFITKEICKAMKGDIRAYSKEGKGTTFIICIPTRSVAPQMHPHLQRSSSSMVTGIIQKKLKAIVADDSLLNIKMIGEFFNQLGVEVRSTATNGLDAYKDYKNYRDFKEMIDIITLDIDMPKLDGKMACQKIREFERQMRLKPAIIILISENYDNEQVNNYLDAHNERRADCFLKKPVKFEEFCSTIYQLITKRDES